MSIRWTYAFVDRPAASFARAHAFWTAVTDTRLSEFRGAQGEFVTLLPGGGADACVKAQGVDSGAGGAHLDFAVDDVPEFVKSALQQGAGIAVEHEGWAVLRSPAGQLFCAVPWHGESVRPPVVHGSRLDQVCVDVPPSLHEAEVAFWSGLLADWASAPGSRTEFHVLRPPAGLPVRILLQRLGEERPGQERPASAHLDLACADIAATRARHEELGAAFVAQGAHWTVMRDPAGGVYCLTARDPETGGLTGSSAS
ncbi:MULTISPECIES: VOC family protein [unclassified Streptomyces]|uniref:VOC family protein n=1 Tax=unclassified Streptomyces TaxID=2593676 RepID=UPI002366088F|nr:MULTISPECIES: VOC family protein [unclassified Streptomyces]MDF3146888.1 VOC family protein [Streptomyces sp. T21Q-yed]WDF41174.1 VOC family protein [Streptomyces sp. T12]